MAVKAKEKVQVKGGDPAIYANDKINRYLYTSNEFDTQYARIMFLAC